LTSNNIVIGNVEIWYTLDNSNPVVGNPNTFLYQNPIIAGTNNFSIKAVTVKNKYRNSNITQENYIIAVSSTPTAAPVSGSILIGSTVSLSTTTPGASIYYTTDGSTPDSTKILYSSPVTITNNTTIKAIAITPNMLNSDIMTESYTIPTVATPTASPLSGQVLVGSTVSLSTSTAGAKIYYTIDGSTPDNTKTLYSTPITINANVTIKAIAINIGMFNSSTMTATYTVPVVATPTATPPAGQVSENTAITLSTTTVGAGIRYTLDGSTPTSGSTLYSSPIILTDNITIKAIGIMTGYINSGILSVSYTVL